MSAPVLFIWKHLPGGATVFIGASPVEYALNPAATHAALQRLMARTEAVPKVGFGFVDDQALVFDYRRSDRLHLGSIIAALVQEGDGVEVRICSGNFSSEEVNSLKLAAGTAGAVEVLPQAEPPTA